LETASPRIPFVDLLANQRVHFGIPQPPGMAHEHAQFATQPVNFGDSSEDDFFNPNSASAATNTHLGVVNNNNEDGRKTYNDHSSVLTGWTSGITVPYSVPLNEEGQTHAQAIVHEYSARGSGSGAGPSPDMSQGTPAAHFDEGGADRKSVGPVSGCHRVYELIYLWRSGLDGLELH
jgi:hypothetical protein